MCLGSINNLIYQHMEINTLYAKKTNKQTKKQACDMGKQLFEPISPLFCAECFLQYTISSLLQAQIDYVK